MPHQVELLLLQVLSLLTSLQSSVWPAERCEHILSQPPDRQPCHYLNRVWLVPGFLPHHSQAWPPLIIDLNLKIVRRQERENCGWFEIFYPGSVSILKLVKMGPQDSQQPGHFSSDSSDEDLLDCEEPELNFLSQGRIETKIQMTEQFLFRIVQKDKFNAADSYQLDALSDELRTEDRPTLLSVVPSNQFSTILFSKNKYIVSDERPFVVLDKTATG